MNAKNEVLRLIGNEKIIAISLAEPAQYFEGEDIDKGLDALDFDFDSGYGSEAGYSIYVWTKNQIIVKGTYDGAEWYTTIPRNPDKSIVPDSIGGG